ncbi:hypothetical protein ACN27F_21745 [Solwaraspora sp. WMMB335]|uniref:hypothetical protein n=1 Tax=Solwaraspora sp. WMMB335 TaxID=3404118 RepID=UPI003B9387DE
MRAHTMGRRLGRVVAVAALGLAVSLTGAAAAYAQAAALPEAGEDLVSVESVAKSAIADSSEGAAVSLRDFEWL